jgi:N-acetylglutamate synthase-like GNAT family acetyltransferase
MAFVIRPAIEADRPAIRALVRGERINPTGLDWRRFLVAEDERGLAGAAQVRAHRDGARELASLVVRREARGRGIASALIDALLRREAERRATGRLFMITGAAFAGRYGRWGFRPIAPGAAPASVRFNYYVGSLAGGALSLLRGRRPRRLAMLERLDVAP